MKRTRRGLTLVEVIVIVALVLFVAFLATPTMTCCNQRASNERNATMTLKTITSAEADFRANDRDGNHVNDYWTANLSGLYTMTSGAVKGAEVNSTTDPSIKLIELSAAVADIDDVFAPAGGEYVSISTFAPSCAKAGHWFAALKSDLSGPFGPDASYLQETNGTPLMGRVHHLTRFGFVALPDSEPSGKYAFIVNENNTIFRRAMTGPWKQGTETPPGIRNVPSVFLHWPDESSLKASWDKLD
jgi:Tfp pilus assembly protein PilE